MNIVSNLSDTLINGFVQGVVHKRESFALVEVDASNIDEI